MAEAPRRYVIVGNGAAGTTCAETLRKADPTCSVTLIDDEPYPLYNRVALPRFIKAEVREERVFMRTIAQHAERGIDLHLETVVSAVDVDGRVVHCEDGGEYPYDALLVATGGRPNCLEAPGAEGTPHIYNFQFMDDTKAIIERLATATHAVVVGGSFIGYELTEGIAHRGIGVTWLMRGPRFLWRALDEDGGRLAEKLAHEHGVEIICNDTVASVERRDGSVSAVVTDGGRRLDCDMVGVGLGLTYNTELLAGAPVETRKAIVTDGTLAVTGVPGVWAAGDVAEFYDVVIERHNQLGTWPNSILHGRLAARNMMGAGEELREVPYYASGLFATSIAVLGLTPEHTPGLESISRLNLEKNHYRRLFFTEGRLVGAAMIGSMKRRREMDQAILERRQLGRSELEAFLEME